MRNTVGEDWACKRRCLVRSAVLCLFLGMGMMLTGCQTGAGGIGGGGNEEPGCIAAADCQAGQVCQNNECVAAPPECTTDSDCEADEICDNGSGEPAPPECTTDADCNAGEVCDNGSCVAATPECTTDADCGTGEICDNGTCVAAPVEPRLFIANFGAPFKVTSYPNPDSVDGNIAPDTNLQGANTLLAAPADIVVNAAGQLVVCNFAVNSITTYDDAAQTNGNITPSGNVVGANTTLAGPASLAYNAGDDLLFVANFTGDQILVFEATTETTFNGNIAPIRTIFTPVTLNNPTGINFGANDDLYVANSANNNVLVYADASTQNGNVAPTRTITSTAFTSVFDVFVDGDDNLYVLNTTGTVAIFNNAATLNGPRAPDITLTLQPPVGVLTAIVVDSNDTGYIVDRTLNAVYTYFNVSTRNGTFAADNLIQGANTQLTQPIRLFLLE